MSENSLDEPSWHQGDRSTGYLDQRTKYTRSEEENKEGTPEPSLRETGKSPPGSRGHHDADPSAVPATELEKDPGIIFSRGTRGVFAGMFFFVVMLAFFLNLFLALATILAGPAIFIPEMDGRKISVFLGFTELGNVGMTIYYLILTAAITLSFYKAIKEDGREFLELMKKQTGLCSPDASTSAGREEGAGAPGRNVGGQGPGNSPSIFSPYLNNTFTLVALFFFVVYSFGFFFDILIEDVLGISRHIPASIFDVPVWQRLLELPEAPVMEELTDRVVLIGIPLYFIHHYGVRKEKGREVGRGPGMDTTLHGRYQAGPPYPGFGQRPDLFGYGNDEEGLVSLVRSLFRKENRRYLLGGGFEWNTQTMQILLLSSAIFAVLHLGWDWTKLIPTFLGGVILGVLFLRKGLHACILLHFAINSFSITYLVAGEPLILDLVLYFIYFGSIPFGMYYLYFYLKYFRRKLETVNLDTKSSEFSKAIVATGGTTLLLFMLIGLFYTGMLALDDGMVEHRDEHYLQFSEDDYQIFEIGTLTEDETLNGSLVLEGEQGETELFIVNRTQEKEWKKYGEVHTGEPLLYVHVELDSPGTPTSQEKTFTLELDEKEDVFLILHAREDSSIRLSYTTTTVSMDSHERLFAVVCGVPFTLILLGLGLGCIYTSNYYRFPDDHSAEMRPGPGYQQPPSRYSYYQLPRPPSYPPPGEDAGEGPVEDEGKALRRSISYTSDEEEDTANWREHEMRGEDW